MLMYIFSLIIPRMQLLYAVFEKSFTPAANFLCFFAYAQKVCSYCEMWILLCARHKPVSCLKW